MKTGWWFYHLPNRPNPINEGEEELYLFSYENLPPIKADLDDNFEWLREKPEIESMYNYFYCEDLELSRLLKIEAQINIKLPKSFLYFIKTKELHYRIAGATNYLMVPDSPIKTVGKYEGFIIQFIANYLEYSNWYLYLDKTGSHFILTSKYHKIRDYKGQESTLYDETSVDLEKDDFWFCAPSFNEFIYRFWLESNILDDPYSLNYLEQEYINHYLSTK